MKSIRELHVLVGLPGSGKTTYTKRYNTLSPIKSQRNAADIVDFDDIFQKCRVVGSPNSTRENIEARPLPKLHHEKLILDGLFLTQDDVEWVIGLFLNNTKFCSQYNVEKIVLDIWKPDRKACRWNDMARQGVRHVPAQFSIDHLTMDKIDIAAIEKKYGIKTKLELHDIVRAPEYQIMVSINSVKNTNGKYLDSATWTLGGTSYGLDGSRHEMTPEQPTEFKEFDALLEKICPQITYLQYKKVYRQCVTMEQRSIDDYYTSGYEGYWRCNLEELYETLRAMSLYEIKED